MPSSDGIVADEHRRRYWAIAVSKAADEIEAFPGDAGMAHTDLAYLASLIQRGYMATARAFYSTLQNTPTGRLVPPLVREALTAGKLQACPQCTGTDVFVVAPGLEKIPVIAHYRCDTCGHDFTSYRQPTIRIN